MKHRWILVVIVLLGGMNEFRIRNHESVAEKIAYAINYYKQEAQHYYLQFTGQIHSPLVIQNDREWREFEPFCDALILDIPAAEKLFSIYLTISDKIHDQRDPNPLFGRGRMRWRHEREDGSFRQEVVTRFQQAIQGKVTQQEVNAVDALMIGRWYRGNPDLRALRYVGLEEEQRKQLLPYTIFLVQNMVADCFEFSPFSYTPEENPQIEKAKADFLAKAQEVLTAKQKRAWESQKQEMSHPKRRRPHYRFHHFPHPANRPVSVTQEVISRGDAHCLSS